MFEMFSSGFYEYPPGIISILIERVPTLADLILILVVTAIGLMIINEIIEQFVKFIDGVNKVVARIKKIVGVFRQKK